MIIDHKNLIYFQNIRIINRRQTRRTLEVQDISFKLEYQKEKDNVIADTIFQRENVTEEQEFRKIFLQ